MSKVKKVKTALKDWGGYLKTAGNYLQKFDKLKGIGQSLSKAGGNLTKFSSAITGWALAAAAAFVAAGYLALQIDKVSKELRKQTGYGTEVAATLQGVAESGYMAGITLEEASKAIGALSSNVSSFNPKAVETNKNLALTVAKLEKVGVSASQSTKSIDNLQRVMGMTAEKAADTTAQIARMGKEIGITGTKMVEDFNGQFGRLAIYGKENIKVFKELEAQSKATGLAISTLTNFSKSFDTFGGAAEKAAKLNAVLGTQLSTIELLNATDSERIDIVRREIKMSVGNFDSLDKYTKQYIANSMGLADVAEAQRLIYMDEGELAKYNQGLKEQADIQAELAEATASLIPVGQRLTQLGLFLFNMLSPLIDAFLALGAIFDWVAGIIAWGMEWVWTPLAAIFKFLWWIIKIAFIGALLYLAGVSATVVGAVMGIIAVLSSLWNLFHWEGSPVFYDIFNHMADSISNFTGSIGDAYKAVKDFVTGGLSSMWDAFHWSGSPELWEMPEHFHDSFVRMADSISNVLGEMAKFVDVMIKFSEVEHKGFLAITQTGDTTSMVLGSEDIVSTMSKGKLTVDVKIPEMKMPDINVKVFIGERELVDIIRVEAAKIAGGK